MAHSCYPQAGGAGWEWLGQGQGAAWGLLSCSGSDQVCPGVPSLLYILGAATGPKCSVQEPSLGSLSSTSPGRSRDSSSPTSDSSKPLSPSLLPPQSLRSRSPVPRGPAATTGSCALLSHLSWCWDRDTSAAPSTHRVLRDGPSAVVTGSVCCLIPPCNS